MGSLRAGFASVLLFSCVILGKVVNFSGRQFTHLSKGENGTYRIGLFGGMNETLPFPTAEG